MQFLTSKEDILEKEKKRVNLFCFFLFVCMCVCVLNFLFVFLSVFVTYITKIKNKFESFSLLVFFLHLKKNIYVKKRKKNTYKWRFLMKVFLSQALLLQYLRSSLSLGKFGRINGLQRWQVYARCQIKIRVCFKCVQVQVVRVQRGQ